MPTAKLLKRLKSDSIHQSVKKFQLLKGYCKKQSSKGKWQKRYFEAKDNYLNYSSNDKSKKVLGSIDLRTVGKISKVGGNRLSLQLEDRVYTIEILQSNQYTCDEWMNGLTDRQQQQQQIEKVEQNLNQTSDNNVATSQNDVIVEEEKAPAASASATSRTGTTATTSSSSSATNSQNTAVANINTDASSRTTSTDTANNNNNHEAVPIGIADNNTKKLCCVIS